MTLWKIVDIKGNICIKPINPFHGNGLFLHPPKISENQEVQKGTSCMKWVYLKIEQQNYGAVTIRDKFKKDPVKCYLRYKTILSQNVRSEVQVKNLLIS